VLETALDGVSDLQFLDGIAGRKLAHHTHMLDPCLGKGVGPGRDFTVLNGCNLDAPMVDVSGQKADILLPGKEGRRQAGTVGDDHAHAPDPILDNGIGGNGGTQDDPLQAVGTFALKDAVRDIQERTHNIA
jgi:hypothetical protein